MTEYIIVSRHPAAVEFIRTTLTATAGAPVKEQVGPDDVRGKIVVGNLPLHLAALAAQVVVVEFTGAPPRGQEYGIAEMRAAGARLARYTVAAIPEPPQEIQWSNGQGSRGRKAMLLVGRGEEIHQFVGQSIENVVGVAGSDYVKNGKWSHTTYTLRLPTDGWHYIASQSWEEGEYFHGCKAVEEVTADLRKVGCTAPEDKLVAALDAAFPKTMERIRATESALKSVE